MSKEGNKVLVTGAAGCIGFHMSKLLVKKGNEVVGIDNLNDYYDISLKEGRLAILNKKPNFIFTKMDLKNKLDIDQLFETQKIDIVINLAAQAGVRYSITNPSAYIDSNLNRVHEYIRRLSPSSSKSLTLCFFKFSL